MQNRALVVGLLAVACAEVAAVWLPRSVKIEGGHFVNAKTGAIEVMNGGCAVHSP